MLRTGICWAYDHTRMGTNETNAGDNVPTPEPDEPIANRRLTPLIVRENLELQALPCWRQEAAS